MLTALAVSGYRSLRDVVVPLAGLNLVTGPNGSGKSNLYRALRLLADVAQGRAIASLAQEGGLASVLWAGPEEIARSVKAGQYAAQGTRRKGPDQPEARVRVGRLRLRHRPRAADAAAAACSSTTRDQARGRVERAEAAAVRRPRRSARAVRALAGRWRLADADAGPLELRQPDDALRRPEGNAGDAAAARVDPRLALLRSLPHRRRLAGAPAADRDAHAGARPRRPRPGGGARDDPHDRRRRGAGRCHRRRLPGLAGVGARHRRLVQRSRCGSTACCGRSAPASSRTARCATCCGWRRC